MRISILAKDPGYASLQALRKDGNAPVVLLDGQRVEHCITADDERGFVITAAIGSDGRPSDWKNPLNRRIARGKVEIRHA